MSKHTLDCPAFVFMEMLDCTCGAAPPASPAPGAPCEHEWVTHFIRMPQGYDKPGGTRCQRCGIWRDLTQTSVTTTASSASPAPGAPDIPKDKTCRSRNADDAVDYAGTASHDAPSVAGAPDIPALIERLDEALSYSELKKVSLDALTALSASHEALADWKESALQSLGKWHQCGETLLKFLPAGESHLGEVIPDVLWKRIPEIIREERLARRAAEAQVAALTASKTA